jgi:hypothetical protein
MHVGSQRLARISLARLGRLKLARRAGADPVIRVRLSPLTVKNDQRIPWLFTLTGGGISWCKLQTSSSVGPPCSEIEFDRARHNSTLNQSRSDLAESCRP